MEGMNLAEETNARIESELEVKAYIQNLKFALNNGAKIEFQAKRRVDALRGTPSKPEGELQLPFQMVEWSEEPCA